MSDTYTITKTLSESATVTLYRGIRRQDNVPVIIKTPYAETPAPHEIERLCHEYEIIRQLDSPYLLKPYELDQQKAWLILEDLDGEPLSSQLDQPLEADLFLRIALQLAAALADIHRQDIVHKDLKPANILFDPQSGAIKLTGFGIATRLMHAPTSPTSMSLIEGSLAYMSPEQTGRMNRPVDYRTDFYSLGITFYKLLTNNLPFTAEDALELVHSHIAGIPVPPHEVNPAIPVMLSRIVLKLMSKMADDRYQSALGLQADLEHCQQKLLEQGAIPEFKLGHHDFSEILQIPHKLYGRKQEIEQLLNSFRQTCSGKWELLLISGYAGVGKTALVQELYRPITEANGYFIEGKFDQLQRNIPYFAWVQAFDGFVNTLLMESELQLTKWRELILQAVGNIGRVLTDIIPNFEHIIGPQPEIPALGSQEALNRMNYVFLEFLRTIATGEHPLVIFLDDLQWIDAASLHLVQTLLRDSEISHLLIIGAYRDNEVDALHPLRIGLELLQEEQTNITRMPLHDLSETAVNEMVSQTLNSSPEQTDSLTHLIYSKTGGNPFFLRQMLKTLENRQALTFDTGDRCWKWDLSQLEKMEISDNVVSLMLAKIQQLPCETQQVLSLAACIGFKFDIYHLGNISGQSEDRALENLQSAFHEGLILLMDEGFQFAHDRIQQAAYSLIPDEEKRKTHLKIGKLLLDHMENTEHGEQLFTVMDHLNIGSKLITNRDERLEFAGLNLQAGLKAKASAAFSAAAKYFDAGVKLLDDRNWETNYDLTIALFNASAEVESLLGNYERADMLFETVLSKAQDPIDTAGVYQARIGTLMSQGKLNDAIDCGLELVDRLGVHLKPHPTVEDVFQSLKETMATYDPENIPAFIDLPEMTDPYIRAAMNVMDSILGPAYSGRPFLNATICFEQIKLTIQNGSTPSMMVPFASYALRLSALPFGDIDQGYEFGRLAIALAERRQAPALIPKVIPPIVGYLWPYKRHMRDVLDVLPSYYPAAKEVGDFEFAGYVTTFYISNAYLAGVELAALDLETASYVDDLKRIRSEVSLRFLVSFLQSIQNLLGKSKCPWILDGEACNRQELLHALQDTGNPAGLSSFHVNTLSLCYMFNRYKEALIASNLAEEQRAGMIGLTIEPIWFFYDSLTRIALYPVASQSEKEAFLERITANQAYLQLRSKHAPMNFLNKWHLVEAEKERVLGNALKAMEHYDRAISLARKNGFIQEEALANELAAEFWLTRGQEDFAKLHMEQAHRCYESWGAVRKVQDLEERYGYLSQIPLPGDKAEIALELLDLSTLMKATHAISSEIEMDRLLDQVMHIVIENAGAESGFLLLERDGVWQITAKGGIGAVALQIPLPVSIEESDVVARSVVRFVARTKETIVLDDAANKGEFISDPYIRRRKTRSLLCVPLLNLDRLIGILYLENNLTTQAFTVERIQLMEMLLTQAAISLENAQIYKALKESEKELRENEERMQLALKGANFGLFDFNIQNYTLIVDDGWFEILGYSPDEIKIDADTWWSWVHPEDRPRQAEAFQDHVEGRSPYYHLDEYRARGKSGDWVWLSDYGKVVEYDSDGKPLRLVGIHLDITERKKTAIALQQRQELLSQAEEVGPSGTFVWDIKTNTAIWSPGMHRLFEIPVEQFNGDPAIILNVVHPDDVNILVDAMRDVVEKKKAASRIEYRITPPSGIMRHIWAQGTLVLDEHGNVTRMIGVSHDITERKQAEEEIRTLNRELEQRVLDRTAQLEAANKELEAFAYSVSHDLRAPLRHIDGFLELLQKRMTGALDERSRHYMDTISDSAKRMGQLIDGLLAFSRMGRNDLSKMPVDLDVLVQEIIWELAPETQCRSINWCITDLPIVIGDLVMLRQALVNLISNALKYTRNCAPANIEIGYQAGDQETIIFIRDNGVGFDMAYADKLFGVFQRLHHSDEFEGTGIGLANVRRIIDRHGGRTWAEGKVNQGATFYFSLPQSIQEI